MLSAIALALGSCADATGPRSAGMLTPVDGEGQRAAAGAALPTPLVVTVTDGRGAPLPEVPVRWSTVLGGGTITPAFGFTDAEGRAFARWSLGPRAGEQAARVTARGLPALTFTARAMPAEPAEVRLVRDSLRLVALDDSTRLDVAVRDAYGNEIVDPPLVFVAHDPAVAVVENDGLVRARGNGTTRVVAMAGRFADTLTVTVRQEVREITLRAAPDSLMAGDTLRLEALLSDANGRPVADRPVDWSAAQPAVAHVDATGLVRAVSSGSTVLTAAVDGARLEVPVTVRTPRFRLERRELSLERLGAEVGVRGALRGAAAEAQQLRVVAEQRWLDEVPVVDAGALARRRVVASGAGTVWIEASVEGAAPDTLVLRVAPGRPAVHHLVLPAAGSAAPVRLRGFAMAALDASGIRANGEPVLATVRDSATIEFHIPTLPNLACGTPAPVTIATPGADQLQPLVIDLPQVDAVVLREGEMLRLSEAQAACLTLSPAPYARYALVFADTRAVDRARAQFSDALALSAPTVRVRDFTAPISAPPAAARRVQPVLDRAAPRTDHLVVTDAAAASATHWRERAQPWRAGERFVVDVPDPSTTHVVRVYGDRFVLATTDTADAHVRGWIARMDSAMSAVLRHGAPLLQQALSLDPPRSAPALDQLLIVVSRSAAAAGTYTHAGAGGAEPFSALVLPEEQVRGAGVAALVEMLMHPLSYAWQARYLAATAREGESVDLQVAQWAREGSATLLVQETLRRMAGISLLGNLDWHQAQRQSTGALRAYSASAGRVSGQFARGDTDAASFLRDLVTRRVAFGGESVDHAVREVVRGAVDGWHGYDRSGNRRPGLTQRMRERMGSAWDPAQALAVWALAQVLDDRVANPRLQNPALMHAAREGTGAWVPIAHLGGGSGAAAEVTWPAGGVQYFLLDDLGAGAAFHLESDTEGLTWMIARIH
jgi:hypothetical protein